MLTEIIVDQSLEMIVDEWLKEAKELLIRKYTRGKIVRSLSNADAYHTNYLEYLCTCWGSHCGAIIDPVYLWQMILCELATVVKDSPESYRNYFTDSTEKKNILIQTDDPIQIDVNILCNELRNLIKEDINMFLPTFSTQTETSKLAHCAAFCDAVSPFYSYSMFLCGIPRVKVMGTETDWMLFKNNLQNLKRIFPTKEEWIDGILSIDFISNDPEFWKGILTMERCGSGSQEEVQGWITKFFINKPKFALPQNFSTHVSEVSYKNISNKKDYIMFSGLFSSKIESGYLIPDYSMIINDVTK